MDFGGINGGGFSTPMNTIGIGDPVPAGINTLGSGDLFTTAVKAGKKGKNQKPQIATKKPAYQSELPYVVYTNNK
jgi:hypothetical protein